MASTTPRQITTVRRNYNTWVATETLEDYALRYAPKSFRKWSEFSIANTALGGISFLALEAIGGSLVISYGFTNSFWAILVVGAIIFLAGIPICYYASKYNIDMDLLTRGAGFGYIGSTITSLIYASFTFIFFALEAAIMAQALELYFHLPLHLGYLLCSLLIIPLVFFGVTLINRLQMWTQPIWIALMISPYIFVIYKDPNALYNWFHFTGKSPSGAEFDPLLFGMAATVSFSLIGQLGEQVDYLRLLPDEQKHNRNRWWVAMILAGPGWIILGVAKQLGGAFLTSLAVSQGTGFEKAVEPIQMYLAGFSSMLSHPELVLTVSTLFVIISQIKINVTNAYAGSLAWSNFFSRLTHNHPGRVVWLVFNIAIALLLMELGVFATLQKVLGLYSNVSIAWIGAVVADLVINKPLGISPSYIEFKRAHLYNFNPVGLGSMLVASTLSIVAYAGVFGSLLQAYAPFIALLTAFTLSPVIALLTQGKYYIARENLHLEQFKLLSNVECVVCGNHYEPEDMAFCPVYDGAICSLCCSLDAHCQDSCKNPPIIEKKHIQELAQTLSTSIFAAKCPQLAAKLTRFALLFFSISSLVGAIISWFYYQEILTIPEILPTTAQQLQLILWKLYSVLIVGIAIASWWLVLVQESRQLAQAELDKQNRQLCQEIEERMQVEVALRQSELQLREQTQQLEQTLRDLKQTESQLIQSEKMSSLGQLVAGIAHEINNPVSFIQGNLCYANEYAQDILNLVQLYQQEYPHPSKTLQEKLETLDLNFLYEDFLKLLQSMQVGANRIGEIVRSLRNFSRLDEAEAKTVDIHSGIESTLMLLQYRLKAPEELDIQVLRDYGSLPLVDCYPSQLNQVFMNILSNAIDALNGYDRIHAQPSIIRIQTKVVDNDGILISIADNGPGMSPEVRCKLFDPFFTTKPVGAGTGLGLSISYQIIKEKHQGNLWCESTLGQGAEFFIQIPLCIDRN